MLAEHGERLIRLRIPVNLLNYRPTILGFDLQRIVLAFLVMVMAVLTFRITGSPGFLVIIPLSLIFFLRYEGRYIPDLASERLKYAIARKEIDLLNPEAETETILANGVAVFELEGEKFSLIRIRGLELSSMRDREQVSIYRSIENMINIPDLALDSYLYCPENSSTLTKKPFQLLRVASVPGGKARNITDLASETLRIMEILNTLNFRCEPVNERDFAELSGRFLGLQNRPQSADDINTAYKNNRIRRNFRYFSSGTSFSDLYLNDATYDLGPAFVEFLRSMNIEFAIRVSIRNFNRETGSDALRRMLAERRAESRSAGSNFRNSQNKLKLQVEDGTRITNLLNDEGILPTRASVMVRIYSQHPAELWDKILRFQNAMAYLGLEFSFPHNLDHSQLNPIQGGKVKRSAKDEYFMNTRSVATILPFLSDVSSGAGGIRIGYNDLNEQPVYLDLYSGTSHNALILGETGSGKSFFSKKILKECLSTYRGFSAVIFDPLMEYGCPDAGETCTILTMGSLADIIEGSSGNDESYPHQRTENNESVVYIVRPDYAGIQEDKRLQSVLLDFVQEIFQGRDGFKMAIFDEFHLMMKNPSVLEKLDSMMRHSRHYQASIVGISQNVTDFTGAYGHSLVFNSASIFIFRTRSVSNADRTALKLDDFDIDSPETLLGGKGHPYSECIYSDGNYARKVRVLDDSKPLG